MPAIVETGRVVAAANAHADDVQLDEPVAGNDCAADRRHPVPLAELAEARSKPFARTCSSSAAPAARSFVQASSVNSGITERAGSS